MKGTITIETLMRHVGWRIGARPPGVFSRFRFIREMATDAVRDFMARPAAVTTETNLVEIVRRVVEDRLNDFPVVDNSNRLLGEVNTLDLLKISKEVFRGNAEQTRYDAPRLRKRL